MVCVVRDMTIVNKDQSLSIKDLNCSCQNDTVQLHFSKELMTSESEE